MLFNFPISVVRPFIFMVAVWQLTGCGLTQTIPAQYLSDTHDPEAKTAVIYGFHSKSRRSVESRIISINGYMLESESTITLPPGTYTFIVECQGLNAPMTVERTYKIEPGKKHNLKALSNRKGGCFFTMGRF